MPTNQMAAIVLSVLAIGGSAVGAATMANGPPDVSPPPWANNEDKERNINVSVDGNVTPGETVTLTVTLHGEPVPHAPVGVNGETVGETAADGTIDVTVSDEDEFEVEIDPDFEGETTVQLGEENDDDEVDEDELQVDVSGHVTPGGTVTVRATHNGTSVENVSVKLNGGDAGVTDADGTLDVTLPADADEAEIEVETDDLEGEWEHEFADEEEEEDYGDDEQSIDIAIDGNVAPNETVTVTSTVNGTPLANAVIKVNGEEVGTTDATGSIQVIIPVDVDEVEVEAELEESGKYKVQFEEDDEEEEEEDENELQVNIMGNVSPGGNVTVTTTHDGSPLENATVTVNDEEVGTTDASGQLDVTIPADADEIEIEAETDDLEDEWEQEFEEEDEEDDG